MSVIDTIPHTLSYFVASEGYEDDNGDWHEGESGWSEPIACHAVPAGKADLITYADGTTSHYSYEIGRLEPNCREFQIGEKVKLNVLGIEREFTVKGFHRWQYQSKLWV